VVHIPELDRTARAGRLSQVEGVARDLVNRVSAEDASSARVVVELRAPEDLVQLLAAAAAAREDPDRVSVEAVTSRRGLARRLAAEGFAVRDVAALLGLSIGRAQQLVGEGSRMKPRKTMVEPRRAAPSAQPHPASVRPHRSYQHEALLFRGEHDFMEGTVPFILEGLTLDQPVMIGATGQRLGQLQGAVGADASGVHFVDLSQLGANPARIIPALTSFVGTFGGPGRPVRAIGETVWPGRRPTEIAECQLHEALLNLAVEPDTPVWFRCVYDANALPVPVLEEVPRSHPTLHVDGAYRGSTTYGGTHHVEALFGAALPDPPPEAMAVPFGSDGLPEVRRLVSQHAATAGLGPDRATDLVAAVTEIATNSIRHGGGQGSLRLWRHEDALICEITDAGHITDPLVGRRTPSAPESGRGLWLANQLADLIQVRSAPTGTTTRLHSWL
jgi:anti-sigma regulatory factor (Ser/Thr protein kinase)